MNATTEPTEITHILERMLATRDKRLVTIGVRNGFGSITAYSNLQLEHRCCRRVPALGDFRDMVPTRMYLVARGQDLGPGPFVFLWPDIGIDVNQPACNGLPLASIKIHE